MHFEPSETFNIADYFLDERLREGRGDRVALRLDDRELTYAQVQDLANRFGQVLLNLGLRREERILIALPDGPEFVGALFGTLKIGAVVVMVNPHLKPADIAALYDYSRAGCLVVDDSTLATFEAGARQARHRPQVLVVGTT
ncbi:MAG: AMP-binding protein, partial [Thermoanaerobaculia bacterium]